MLSHSSANTMFSGQRDPLEEGGGEAEGVVAAWLGDVGLRAEQY